MRRILDLPSGQLAFLQVGVGQHGGQTLGEQPNSLLFPIFYHVMVGFKDTS